MTKPIHGIENTREPVIEPNKIESLTQAILEEVGHLDLTVLGELIHEIDRNQYEYTPVDIETFIFDDKYLGQVVGGTIFPIWVDTLKKIYPTPYFSPYSEVIVSACIGAGKSTHENTRVLTNNGILKIKDVKNGSVRAETGEKQIKQVFDNGYLITKKLKFRTGKEVEASPEHKFRVLEKNGTIVWKPVGDMVVGEKVLSQLKEHILSTKKLDTGLAYLLGLISGDGHVSHPNKENLRVNIGMTIGHQIYNSEPVFINEFTELFTKYVGEFSFHTSRNNFCVNKSNPGFGQYLLEQGFYESKEVYLKRVPECVFEACKEDILDYLAGLIDTDGHVYKKGIEIAFKHEPFAQDVQILLSALGVYSKITPKYNKKYDKTYYIMYICHIQSFQNLKDLNLRISYKKEAFQKLLDKKANMNTRITYPYLKEYLRPTYEKLKAKYSSGLAGRGYTSEQIEEMGNKRFSENWDLFALYRNKGNQNITLETLEQIKEIYGDEFSTPTTDYLIEHQVMLDEVISIEESETEQHVYDIGVDEDHSYLVNGLVSHNSTVSTVGLVYDIYRVLCLKNPQKYYGLMEDTKIVFMMFSRTKALAQGVNYEYLQSFFAKSPFFIELIGNKRSSKSSVFDSGIELVKNVYVEIGSQIRHALGKAVFGAVLDEANFQNENSKQAEETYFGILNRMQSRFQAGGGIIPGTLFVMSSPKSANSFLEDRITQAKKDTKSFVLDNVPMWEVKKHILNMYCGKTFLVFMGSETQDPFIVDDYDSLTEEQKNNLLEVPIEYYESFDKDLLLSINDIAGRSLGSSLNLIKSKKLIMDMMVIPNEQRFTKPVIQLSFSDDNDTLMKYMNLDYFKNPYKKHCYRFIHIDLAKNRDRTGIAACFAEDITVVTHQEQLLSDDFNFEDGNNINQLYQNGATKSKVSERMYYLDWVLSLENVKGEDIPFDKIVDFLRYLKDIGYPVMMVTTDGFQGEYLRQRLSLKGLKTEYLSISSKRNKQGRSYFLNFVDVLKKQRIISVNHPILYKELSELIDDGEIVTHPQISPTGGEGHDDTALAAVSAFTKCFQARIIQSSTELMLQGYQNKTTGNNLLTNKIKGESQNQALKAISKKFYIKKYF